ncbi:MAG: YihY/virulence factor BrkB family protein [Chitinophagaceae bacterium]|nr:YihY/virulence factor BrkB family protein [Chitinophagaceae bacterium]
MARLQKNKKWKAPLLWVIKRSRLWKPPGFQGLTLHDVSRYIFRHFDIPQLTEKAAAISFNFIMALPPIFLFLFTLIPNLPFVSKKILSNQLHNLIRDIIPSPEYNTTLISFVDSFIFGSQIGILSFTFILSLFFASNAVMGLMRAFNKSDYIGFEKHKGLRQRWMALKLTFMLFGLLLATLLLLFLQSNILTWMGIENRLVSDIILSGRWVFIAALIFFSYSFIYRYAPSTTKRWKFFSPGTIIATILSIAVTLGFRYFLANFGRYNILYGSLGTIMVVMIMIYLNSLVIFTGFIINLSIHTLITKKERRRQR